MAYGHQTWRIWLSAVALAVAGSLAMAWQVVHSRQTHLDAALQLAQSLSNAAAQRIGGSLRSLDVLLIEASENVGDPAAIDIAGFQSMRSKIAGFPEIGGIAVIDDQGLLRRVFNTGRPGPESPMLDVSDRPHFRFQREHFAERRLFVGPPTRDRLTGQMMIFVARPILGAEGQFRGMVAMAARPAFIAEALASAIPAEHDAAGAFDRDGLLYQRIPEDDRWTGRSIADTDVFRAYQQIRGPGSHDLAVSFSDGRERVVGFTPVANSPLVAVVGIDRDRVLAAWRRELLVYGALQGVFVAVIFLLAWGLARSEVRRSAVSEQLLAAERGHIETLAKAVEDRTAELNDSLSALSESEERFRLIVDISPLPLVLTRRTDSRVLYINTDAAKTFGVPQQEAEGRVAPDYWDDPADRAKMVEVLTRDGHIRNFETTLKRFNGERFTALLSAATVTLRGDPLVLVSVLDITERKRLEEDLARSNRDLEQFSYAVSHDLQEPLRMVSSYLGLLDRRYGQSLTDDAKEFIGFAVDGAQRMSRMITDLLEYSRVHRKGSRFAPVPLDEVLGDALRNLSTAVQDAGAAIRAEPLPTVMGDASQLMRVFQNLIGNALKYRLPGIAPEITVTAEREAGYWRVSVTDNGIGIDPAVTGRLFQVFQRLHPRGAYEGSGVGLALCRRILERHNGHIWVDSEGEGKGSAFRFTLPAAMDAEAREP